MGRRLHQAGGPRRTPGEARRALDEGIATVRRTWERGPAPVHDVEVWVGAIGPKMLELTGRTRSAAVAQLEALNALLAVTGPAPRPTVVSVVTAAVHAVAAGDVLPADTVAAMCRPFITHLR